MAAQYDSAPVSLRMEAQCVASSVVYLKLFKKTFVYGRVIYGFTGWVTGNPHFSPIRVCVRWNEMRRLGFRRKRVFFCKQPVLGYFTGTRGA
jgi:hypothetical protein